MSILDRIFERWEDPGQLALDREGHQVEQALRDAAVALLLEAGYGDAKFLPEEREVIRRGIEQEFGVGDVEAAAFMDSAQGVRPPRRKLEQITSLVRDGYDLEQKKRLVELLWKTVSADHEIASFEQAFVEHVSAALDLTPAEGLEARARAEP